MYNNKLYFTFEVNDSIDLTSSTDYYRIYISTSNNGNSTTPENKVLSHKYDYRIQINASECYLFNYT